MKGKRRRESGRDPIFSSEKNIREKKKEVNRPIKA